MRVRPSSEHSRRAFDWGRANFLQEARTLARFDHPSIVRITRVFEANATPYMVMRFEVGLSFYARALHQRHASTGRVVSIYALGGLLYLAITGRPPLESTLRAFEDCMQPAMASAAADGYRRAFVAAIDACLRHSERPQSVAQLRQMLFSPKSRPLWADRLLTSVREPIQRSTSTLGQLRRGGPYRVARA